MDATQVQMQLQLLPAENLGTIPGIYSWGIDVIRAVQNIETPALTALMRFISELGTEKVYLPLILFIFWLIDEKKGLRLGILIIVSAWLNIFLKDLFRQPRPFFLEASLGLAHEPSYGIPSEQAQLALCFWIPVAAWLSQLVEKAGQRRFIWAGAILLVLIISFSYMYLGLHFPTDILAGWAVGGILLVIWFVLGPYLIKFFGAAGTRPQNICIAAIALTMNGLYPADRTLPALFLGFCIGYTMMKSRFPFSAKGEVNGKKPGLTALIVRCLTGFLGMAIIFIGSRFILPGEGSVFRDFYYWGIASPYYELGQFVRYGLIGLWVSAGAPKIFQQMGLAHNTSAEGSQ